MEKLCSDIKNLKTFTYVETTETSSSGMKEPEKKGKKNLKDRWTVFIETEHTENGGFIKDVSKKNFRGLRKNSKIRHLPCIWLFTRLTQVLSLAPHLISSPNLPGVTPEHRPGVSTKHSKA